MAAGSIPRWALFSLAALVVLLDFGSKQWAVTTLASAVHPMVIRAVDAGASRSLASALRERGLSDEAIRHAAASGVLVRYEPARDLRADAALSAEQADVDLIALSGSGLAPPRRLRIQGSDLGQTLGSVAARAWRIDADAVQPVLDTATYRATSRIGDASAPVAAGQIVALQERSIVVSGNFHLVYAENFGAAWGFLSTAPALVRQLLFVTISLIASIAMGWTLWQGRMATRVSTWALAAVMGGAVGNLIDRVRYRAVVDFIYNFVTIGDTVHGWPVWNIADAGITVGVVAIALEMLLTRTPAAPQTPDAPKQA